MKKLLILLIGILFVTVLNAQYTNKLTYPLYLGKTGTVTGSIYFYGLTSGIVQLKVPDIAGSGIIFQLPSSNGTADYVLKTDGAGVLSWADPTNWNTAYTDRLKWDGGGTDLVAATGRTSLGGTDIGQAFFIMTNPSAITFPRINADNSVTAQTATEHNTATGALPVADTTTMLAPYVHIHDTTTMLDRYSLIPEVSAQINDSSTKWLAAASIGLTLPDSLDGSSGNDYFMSPDQVAGYVETHGGALNGEILKFIIGVTTGAPATTDSTLIHSHFGEKKIDLYRDGALAYYNETATNTVEGYRHRTTSDTIFVNPLWQDNERIEIRILEPIKWDNISIEGQESPLVTGLVAYYKMDESATGSTTLIDAIGNQNVTSSASTTAKSGKIYNGRYFGLSSSVTVPNNMVVLPHDTAYTIAMWLYLENKASVSGDAYLFRQNNSISPSAPHSLRVEGDDNKLYFSAYNALGTQYSCKSTTELDDSTWYHVTAVCPVADGSEEVKIYVNGVDVSDYGGSAHYIFTDVVYEGDQYMSIGNAYAGSTQNVDGIIDEVAIYAIEQSAAYIEDLYEAGIAGKQHPWE